MVGIGWQPERIPTDPAIRWMRRDWSWQSAGTVSGEYHDGADSTLGQEVKQKLACCVDVHSNVIQYLSLYLYLDRRLEIAMAVVVLFFNLLFLGNAIIMSSMNQIDLILAYNYIKIEIPIKTPVSVYKKLVNCFTQAEQD